MADAAKAAELKAKAAEAAEAAASADYMDIDSGEDVQGEDDQGEEKEYSDAYEDMRSEGTGHDPITLRAATYPVARSRFRSRDKFGRGKRPDPTANSLKQQDAKRKAVRANRLAEMRRRGLMANMGTFEK